MLSAYARALLPRRRHGGELPSSELVRRVTVDRDHLAAYARVCGFDVGGDLPLPYPHVLGFETALELMTAPGFPYPVLGLVHLANTFTRTRTLDAGEPLELRVRAGSPGEHPRGRTFVITTDALVDGAPVWTGRSTYLHRSGGGDSASRPRSSAPEGPAAAQWRIEADAGRRYAAVSGDRNPIHLHALAARPFGFRTAIAHGMWTVARCLAALAPHTAATASASVDFGAPVPLPSTVSLYTGRAGDGWRFALHGAGGRRHLSGELTVSSPGGRGLPSTVRAA